MRENVSSIVRPETALHISNLGSFKSLGNVRRNEIEIPNRRRICPGYSHGELNYSFSLVYHWYPLRSLDNALALAVAGDK